MDIDKDESTPPVLPNDDFGAVRERRDFGPMDVPLHPILPSPFRDFSFSGLTGWRYYPTAHEPDRLGILVVGKPSREMVIPDSWNDRVIDHTKAIESTRRQLEQLQSWDNAKRQRMSSDHIDPKDVTMSENDSKHGAADGAEKASPFEMPSKSLKSQTADTRITPQEASHGDDATLATASTADVTQSTAASSSSAPPAASIANLAGPDMIPKQELYFLYGKGPQKVQIKGADYLTWDNGKPVQDVRYTAAFVCPITKEIFLAGSYGDSGQKEGDIWWYPKKNLAEHAAAARAFDCLKKRDGKHRKRLSQETPYFKNDAPELPIAQFPAEIQEKIQVIQKEQARLDEEFKKKTNPVNPTSSTRPPREKVGGGRVQDGRRQQYHKSNGPSRGGRGREPWNGDRSPQLRDRRYDRVAAPQHSYLNARRSQEYQSGFHNSPSTHLPQGDSHRFPSHNDDGSNDYSGQMRNWSRAHQEGVDYVDYDPLGNHVVRNTGFRHDGSQRAYGEDVTGGYYNSYSDPQQGSQRYDQAQRAPELYSGRHSSNRGSPRNFNNNHRGRGL